MHPIEEFRPQGRTWILGGEFELSCNLVFFGEDFDLLPCLKFIMRGLSWLDFDHLRLFCLTSSKLPILECCCLGLIFGVQLLS